MWEEWHAGNCSSVDSTFAAEITTSRCVLPNVFLCIYIQEVPCGASGEGSGIITAAAQVASLAWELLHVMGGEGEGERGRERKRENERTNERTNKRKKEKKKIMLIF